MYRELASRESRKNEQDSYNVYDGHHHQEDSAVLHQRERALVGSLTTANTSYNFKQNGLIKKTIRILVNGNFLHIVSYYSKHDVLNNLLPTPSSSPELAGLQISADLMPHLQGYATAAGGGGGATAGGGNQQEPIRKRSKSSDSHHNNNNNSNKRTYDQIYHGGGSDNGYNQNKIYYSQLNYSRSTPFTELPPPPPIPAQQLHQHYNSVTTAKAPAYANKSRKIYHGNSPSDPLSPSPTPSPPAAILCDSKYYNRPPPPPLTPSFDPYRHHHQQQQHPPQQHHHQQHHHPATLDNY